MWLMIHCWIIPCIRNSPSNSQVPKIVASQGIPLFKCIQGIKELWSSSDWEVCHFGILWARAYEAWGNWANKNYGAGRPWTIQLFTVSSLNIQRSGGGRVFHNGHSFTQSQGICNPHVSCASCSLDFFYICASCELCGWKFHLGSGWIPCGQSIRIVFLFYSLLFSFCTSCLTMDRDQKSFTSSGDLFPFTSYSNFFPYTMLSFCCISCITSRTLFRFSWGWE